MSMKDFVHKVVNKLNGREKYVATHPDMKSIEGSGVMKKIRMNVKGKVQGVGFRYMTKMVADKIGIRGCVWNEDDGSVSIEAIGNEEQMDLFIRMIKTSPSPSGRVDHFEMNEDLEIEERQNFAVVYK